MEKNFAPLYSEDDLKKLRRQAAVWTAVTVFVAAAALAVCVYLCATAARAHDKLRLPVTIAVSIGGGWIAITLWRFVIFELRSAIRHTEAILSGEAEIVEGVFTLTKDRLYIVKGVTMTRVEVSGNGNVRSLQIYEKKKKRFMGVQTGCVKAVHGFIAAYEVEDEDRS